VDFTGNLPSENHHILVQDLRLGGVPQLDMVTFATPDGRWSTSSGYTFGADRLVLGGRGQGG
jgi:hypothetical protein